LCIFLWFSPPMLGSRFPLAALLFCLNPLMLFQPVFSYPVCSLRFVVPLHASSQYFFFCLLFFFPPSAFFRQRVHIPLSSLPPPQTFWFGYSVPLLGFITPSQFDGPPCPQPFFSCLFCFHSFSSSLRSFFREPPSTWLVLRQVVP